MATGHCMYVPGATIYHSRSHSILGLNLAKICLERLRWQEASPYQ